MRTAAALGVLAVASLAVGGLSGRFVLGWGAAALLAAAAFASTRRRAGRSAQPASVTLDAEGISVLTPADRPRSVSWNQLVEVSVLTTADGPLADDVFLVLRGADGSACIVPHALVTEFVGHLLRLPGFDHQRFIEAMGSTDEARVVCWKGRPGDALAAVGELPADELPRSGGVEGTGRLGSSASTAPGCCARP